ncbi:MAG TPA: phosphatase PAP2 family protein [Candidatus Solibacter sp.]|nr:phosphatase PAP2 family protein [Candidatus Solibacter sp.]
MSPTKFNLSFTDTRAFRVGATAVLLAAIVALSVSRDFYMGSMVSAYLSLALASALIVLEMIRRSWMDLLWTVTGALVLAVIDFRVLNFQPLFMAAFSFLGLSALAVLGARTIWADGEERKLLLYGFLPAVLFVGSEWMATTLLDITEKLHPKTFDLFLYSFDSSLRVQISFLVGQLLWTLPWLRFACLVIYIALPLPLALVYAAQLRGRKDKALTVMLAFLVTGPIGVLFYNMLPACGPVHVFGQMFPWHPLSAVDAMHMTVAPVLLKGARNAIPSLHMTWVLLVWWNSRGLARWVRAIAFVFLVLTAMATVGTGEHYFVDLVVAFPFSLMVQSLCSFSLPFRSGERKIAFLFGTFVTLVWLALLSFSVGLFWSSPVVPWAMVVATVGPSIYLWNRLLRAGSVESPVVTRAVAATA